VIQINNTNTAQTLYLKLEGYSEKVTTELLDIEFTNQLTNRKFKFVGVTVLTTNGRYQSMTITPPAETSPPTNATMEEGMYLVTFIKANRSSLLSTRLAFVSSVPAFKESTYEAYTEGDETQYNVYTNE
tara:strand:- start:1979 stop:2365 length:387 start_codon:yes stop_codon:yes gene_type:complete